MNVEVDLDLSQAKPQLRRMLAADEVKAKVSLSRKGRVAIVRLFGKDYDYKSEFFQDIRDLAESAIMARG